MIDKPKEKKVTHHEAERPKTCVGELCWNPKTERLEFEFDRVKCPREIVEKLENQTPMILRAKAPPFPKDKEEKP